MFGTSLAHEIYGVHTMENCDIHGQTDFVFVEEDGKKKKVCKKCRDAPGLNYDDY